MATSYPTGIDSFTDPAATDPMNSPSHSGEHTNANDAINAIETHLGTTASPNFLPVTGGTMSGAIAMGSNKVTGLANGSASSDGAAFGQIPTALSQLSGNIVTEFNTRTGNVTLAVGDVEALFTAAGQILLGTGSGTGELLALGSANTALVVNSGGTQAAWTAIVNSAVAGTGVNVSAATGAVTFSVDTTVVVTLTGTQTLTNKTLTSPIISTITNTGTVTLPTATDTLVGRATTDTLTNKRVTKRVYAYSGPGATPTIDTDTYDVVNMTALAAAITSMTTNLSGTPNSFDSLILGFTDNGTARTIAWGTSFEASTIALPTTTVVSTLLIVGFLWNPTTSKWRCVGVS